MLICKEKNFIFIRNPRTGSRSFSEFLIENFKCEVFAPYHSVEIPKEYENYTIYITIRDPIKRTISAYSYLLEEKKRFPEKRLAQGIGNFQDFLNREEFIVGPPNIEFNFFYQSEILKKIKKYKTKIILYEKINKHNMFLKKNIKLKHIGKTNEIIQYRNYNYKKLKKEYNYLKNYKIL